MMKFALKSMNFAFEMMKGYSRQEIAMGWRLPPPPVRISIESSCPVQHLYMIPGY